MVCKSVCGGCLCIPHEDIQSACVALKHARLLCSWLQLAISRSSVAIKAFLQQDKTRFVDHVCAFAAKAADESNARALYWAVKRLKKFKAAPLRGVLLRDGARALTPSGAAVRWQEHFCLLLKGEIEQVPWRPCANGTSKPSASDLQPSLDDLRVLVAKAPCGRNPGPDALTYELLKAGGEPMIRHLHLLFSKICSRVSVPPAMKVGILVGIFKGKGNPMLCENSRGVVMEDHTQKLLAKHLRWHPQPCLWLLVISHLVPGAVEPLIWPPSLFVWGADLARHSQQSFAVVFADLRAAFDTIVREIAMGHIRSDRGLCDILSRLNVAREEKDLLVHWWSNSKGVAELVGLDKSLIDMLVDMHTGTCFFNQRSSRHHCQNLFGSSSSESLG